MLHLPGARSVHSCGGCHAASGTARLDQGTQLACALSDPQRCAPSSCCCAARMQWHIHQLTPRYDQQCWPICLHARGSRTKYTNTIPGVISEKDLRNDKCEPKTERRHGKCGQDDHSLLNFGYSPLQVFQLSLIRARHHHCSRPTKLPIVYRFLPKSLDPITVCVQ